MSAMPKPRIRTSAPLVRIAGLRAWLGARPRLSTTLQILVLVQLGAMLVLLRFVGETRHLPAGLDEVLRWALAAH